MNSFQHEVREVVLALEELCARVRTVRPDVLCQVGEIHAKEPVQAYASFLADPAAESIDLCIYFRQTNETLEISGDLVRGCSGEVLSDFSGQGWTDTGKPGEAVHQITAIKSYILLQEANICDMLQHAPQT